jgi:hypothetical protein
MDFSKPLCFGIPLFQIAVRWARLSVPRCDQRLETRQRERHLTGEMTSNPKPASTIGIKRGTANFAQLPQRDDAQGPVATASLPETGSASLRDYLSIWPQIQ